MSVGMIVGIWLACCGMVNSSGGCCSSGVRNADVAPPLELKQCQPGGKLKTPGQFAPLAIWWHHAAFVTDGLSPLVLLARSVEGFCSVEKILDNTLSATYWALLT